MKSNYTPLTAKEIRKRKKRKIIILFITGFILYMFVYYNIIASQKIHPLYYGVINENRSDVVELLREIRTSKLYNEVLVMQKGVYGEDIEGEVNKEVIERNQTISKLETALRINPKSPQILKNISLLYLENGDSEKANEFLIKAREIDPVTY